MAVWGDLEVHPTAVPSLQVGVLLGPLPSSAWKPLCALKKFCSCLYQKKKCRYFHFTFLFICIFEIKTVRGSSGRRDGWSTRLEKQFPPSGWFPRPLTRTARAGRPLESDAPSRARPSSPRSRHLAYAPRVTVPGRTLRPLPCTSCPHAPPRAPGPPLQPVPVTPGLSDPAQMTR